MRLAVLNLASDMPGLTDGFPTDGAMIADWLRPALPEARLDVIDLTRGVPLPEMAAHDGLILSGSELGVYDQADWMAGLRDRLLAVRDANLPVFGVCFGHQLMADVYGGKAEKVSDPVIGVRAFTPQQGPAIEAHVWHQDQVTQLPPEADVFLAADYCPHAALQYRFPALSVQFHPEYGPDFPKTIVERGRGSLLSDEAATRIATELAASRVPGDLFAAETAAFFQAHLE